VSSSKPGDGVDERDGPMVQAIPFPDTALGKNARDRVKGEAFQASIPAGTHGGTTLRLAVKGCRKSEGKGRAISL